MNTSPSQEKCALIVGHPGHELRILSWMQRHKPLVIILTDGAAHGEEPRTDLSRDLVNKAASACPSIFGHVPDQEIYRAILAQDFGLFVQLSNAMADIFVAHGIRLVAGDSIEGYNPTHDLCRLMIDRAVRLAEKRTGNKIRNFQFPLVAHPAAWAKQEGAICHALSSDELQEKVAIIRSYAETAGGELVKEVEEAFAAFGEKVLAEEWLSPASSDADFGRFENHLPFYERHGEKRVAEGHYKFVIRYKEHMLPLARALRE